MLIKDCKVRIKMDPIFSHSVFDNAKKKNKKNIGDVLSQCEKLHKTLVNSLYVCYRFGRNNICSVSEE